MKKTIILVLILGAVSISAQLRLPDFPNGERVLGYGNNTLPARHMPTALLPETTKEEVPVAEVHESGVAPRMLHKGEARRGTANFVGYLNPDGTLFLGLDEAGKGAWFKKNAIVGAWSDSIWHWTYRQTVTGAYDSIRYTNKALKTNSGMFEDAQYFYCDKEGNWCDSIVSNGGIPDSYMFDLYGDNTDYSWFSDMPLQTVYRRDTTESFMLLTSAAKPTVGNAGFTVGGLPSSNSEDGLWPLTNATAINREGISIAYLSTTDEDGYVHYIFGTDSLNTDTIGGEDGAHYTRVAPVKIVTEYDKPQAPLYVKNITVAMSAKGNSQAVNKIRIEGLTLNVIDKDGHVIATSTATQKDLKKISYPSMAAGRILTFNFATQSEYGEPLEEGFLVSDAFSVEISGISETDVFGMYSAKSTVRPSHTYIEYEGGIKAGQDYDPYLMLNGIYNTLETQVLSKEVAAVYDVENDGDTIPINMISVTSPYYKYRGYYAAEDYKEGNVFEYASTFMPYDSVSRYWLMDVRKPEYIELGCDFSHNYGTEENPLTLWNLGRLFDLYIYATGTPRIGDVISVGKCGRHAVFRIRAIDGATAINEVHGKAMNADVRKVMDHRGLVRILRGNKQYNILGQPIH